MATSIPRRAEPIRFPSGRALAIVVAASTFVALAALFAISRSSLFGLRHVEIAGAGHRSAADIRARAHLASGTNVVWLDTSAVAERLLADPWIARVSVTRSLPWTVEIAVQERAPVGVVGDGGSGTLIAADGTHLGPAPATTRLPRISLPTSSPALVRLPSESGAVRALAHLVPLVRHRVREVDVLIGGTLILRLAGGVTVDLGEAVNLEEKAAALRRLLVWSRGAGAAFRSISLVSPSAPGAQLQP